MQRVQSPIVPVVAELIRASPGTISLGQGVVNYPPPRRAIAAIEQFLGNPDNHKYQHVQGIPELIGSITEKLERENLASTAAREIVVTAGSNMGFLNAILAIADPGDEVILLRPYYFNHEMAVTIAGCRPVIVDTDDAYQPQLELIEAAITARTRAVVTVTPNNPTGAVYSRTSLQEINRLCGRRGLYHISDEAYEYFTFDGATHFSPLSISGAEAHTIGLFSLSKAYGFASWRIGYMLLPSKLCDPVKKIQDTNLICPPVICQHAARGALEAGLAYCEPHLERLAAVRELVLRGLSELGERILVPRADGAFYFLIRISTEMSAMDLVERLIREHRVAVIPGTTFGVDDRCCVRVAYGALERETVAEGVGRFVQGVKAIVG